MGFPRVGRAAIAALGVACHHFESVDDACKDDVRGSRHGSPEAAEFFTRVSCYRRFAGLGQANVERHVSDAVESHAAYLEANGVGADWQLEDLSKTGFTGADAYERLDRAGYLTEAASTFVWEVLAPVDPALPRGDLVDGYIHHPSFRDVLLAPGWIGGGYDEFAHASGTLTYFNVVLEFPSGSHVGKPIVYPADGQTDVPVSLGGLVGLGPTVPTSAGYPITMTFGSTEASLAASNPLGIQVLSSLVTGPAGPVEHVVVLPALYDYGVIWSTATLVPLQALDPETEYVVTVDVGWQVNPSKSLEWTFTTGSERATMTF